MTQQVLVELRLPKDLGELRFPRALDRRLQALLDRQDQGEKLSQAERREAEALVDMAELISLLRLRATNVRRKSSRAR